MGHEPGKRHRYGYYRESRGSRVKSLLALRARGRGKEWQMKRDAYNLPISLLSLCPPGSSTSQRLPLCPTCLLSANYNSTRYARACDGINGERINDFRSRRAGGSTIVNFIPPINDFSLKSPDPRQRPRTRDREVRRVERRIAATNNNPSYRGS